MSSVSTKARDASNWASPSGPAPAAPEAAKGQDQSCEIFIGLPSGKTYKNLWKISIFTRSINHKWQVSMAMLNYQMVDMGSSINGGTHKWMVLQGKMFFKKTWMRTGSTPIFENPHMAKQQIEMGLLFCIPFRFHLDVD